MTKIGAFAFYDCRSLTSITIPDKVTAIQSNAFEGCKNLKTVKGGKNVKSIGMFAFAFNPKLQSISIGSKVTKIGKSAFWEDKKLKRITIKTKKLTSSKVGKDAFADIHPNAVIKVPKQKVRAYKALFRKKGLSKNATVKKL